MTQKQLIQIARRFGALAGQNNIDEWTRRQCVDVIENIANTAGGFNQVNGGYFTEKISLQDWRKLANTDRATASHRLMRENTDLDNKS